MANESSPEQRPWEGGKAQAVVYLRDKLVERGINPDHAAERAEAASARLYFGGKGPVRVLEAHSNEAFYPASWSDPLGPLVEEIYRTTADEHRLDAVRRREEQVAELQEQKIASGGYRI